MHDSIAIPACFSSGERQADDPATTVARSGQSVFMSIYRTKLAGECRLITVTWCKNLLLHGLSVSVEGPDGSEHYRCKVELKPWYFWRKQGSKHITVDGRGVDIFWDLKAAKFSGETEPRSDYYVAIVCEEEVVLLLGDLKKDAFRKTRCRPSLMEPMLVSRKEHVFGKKKFSTRVKFQEKGATHDISIECNNNNINCSDSSLGGFDPELEIRVDGKRAVHVRHLQWKFRGNAFIRISKMRVEVYWDVHDWLFGSGARHGLFIFKPVSITSSSVAEAAKSAPSSPGSSSSSAAAAKLAEVYIHDRSSTEDDDGHDNAGVYAKFCLSLYAWKVE